MSGASESTDTVSVRPAKAPAGLRRRLVKTLGKKLLHGGFDGFVARQSLIPDTPVIEPAWFAWAAELQRNWPAIRAELDARLRDREALPNFQDQAQRLTWSICQTPPP